MAAKKKSQSADMSERKANASLKKTANYFSGKSSTKPATSADAKAGRGAARRQSALKSFGSESKKKATGVRPVADLRGSEGPTVPAVYGKKKQPKITNYVDNGVLRNSVQTYITKTTKVSPTKSKRGK